VEREKNQFIIWFDGTIRLLNIGAIFANLTFFRWVPFSLAQVLNTGDAPCGALRGKWVLPARAQADERLWLLAVPSPATASGISNLADDTLRASVGDVRRQPFRLLAMFTFQKNLQSIRHIKFLDTCMEY